MQEIQEKLPKTAAVLKQLLAQANVGHLHRLDRTIDEAIKKAWASIAAHRR